MVRTSKNEPRLAEILVTDDLSSGAIVHSVEISVFSVTQILREIKVSPTRDSKSARFSHLEALNFDFYEFRTSKSMKFTKLAKFRAPKMAKM